MRKQGNRSQRRGFNTCGFADKHHDIVAVSPIVDAGDPRWIRKVGKGDHREQDQHRNDRKKGADPSVLSTTRSRRWHRLPRTRPCAHPSPPGVERPEPERASEPTRAGCRCQHDASTQNFGYRRPGRRSEVMVTHSEPWEESVTRASPSGVRGRPAGTVPAGPPS
jgi:hypothetical protein